MSCFPVLFSHFHRPFKTVGSWNRDSFEHWPWILTHWRVLGVILTHFDVKFTVFDVILTLPLAIYHPKWPVLTVKMTRFTRKSGVLTPLKTVGYPAWVSKPVLLVSKPSFRLKVSETRHNRLLKSVILTILTTFDTKSATFDSFENTSL